MRKTIPLIIGMLFFAGLTSSGVTYSENNEFYSVDDMSMVKYLSVMYESGAEKTDKIADAQQNFIKTDYPIGSTIWQYIIDTSWDNSPKAISYIPDINNDGIDDVIVCSEDDYVRCFDGAAIGTGIILWEHQPTADVFFRKGLTITEDIDGDGYEDLVIGTNGGTYTGRLIRALSATDGSVIWTHDTHEYGTGGWVYAVDSSYDFNNDDVLDVLAATGDDSTDTGPKRIYCLDGLTGLSIWECPLGGPGFEVIGVEDFTGDGHPDVVAGCSNEGETIGYARGINGATGIIDWTFSVPGTSVWAIEQLDDITSDGIKDIIIGDFYSAAGNIYGIDPTDGSQIYHQTTGALMNLHFEKIGDVDSDGYTDIVPSHTNHWSAVFNGYSGDPIWTHAVADQAWNADQIGDITGDGIDDVIVGTLFQSNYLYFLNGVDGSELISIAYGEAIDALASIPDVVNDGSMEMVAGGRDGKVTCISGGLDATNSPPSAPTIDGPAEGRVNISVDFSFMATDPNGNEVYYYVEWGDDTNSGWVGPFVSGETISLSHTYTVDDAYTVLAKAKDSNGAQGNWSDPFEIVIVENFAPETPSISGPTSGKAGEEHDYTFVATDANDDQVYYYVDWGDNTSEEWIGPYDSGEEITIGHIWEEQGDYTIQVKAKDEFDAESDWGTLDITMPVNKVVSEVTLLSFISNLISQFFNMFPLIKTLLGLI